MKQIESLEIENLENPIKVYNFEVEDWHTYHVSDSDILVHNDCSQGSGSLKISSGNLDHITKKHNPNLYAKQLGRKPQVAVLKEMEYKSFFNKNWSNSQIDEAVNFGYNQAVRKGLAMNKYSFTYADETITIAFENGLVQSAWGSWKYTIEELLNLLK